MRSLLNIHKEHSLDLSAVVDTTAEAVTPDTADKRSAVIRVIFQSNHVMKND
jgi:hypothetical protein